MKFTLKARQNENTGEMGWLDSRIRGSDVFEPLSGGLGLAHDCLEHAAFDSVADEIEAHGAMYRIRYEGGWSSGYGYTLSIDSFASEWENLLRGLMAESYLPDPPKTRPLDATIEEDISSIIEQGKAYCMQNFLDFEPDNSEAIRDLERIASVFRAHFRRGYRKAGQRFKGLASCEVAAMFECLSRAFERHEPTYEEEEIVVTVNLRTQSVRIEAVMELDEY
jgi:hypothetical protein